MNQPSNFQAICHALFSKELSYYPQRDGKTIEVPDLMVEINTELKDLNLEPDKAKNYIDRAKDSLEEVKKHTEYQDQKVSRLLTIVAFLTAAAGTIFGKMVDTYPLYAHIDHFLWSSVLIILSYALFGAYLIFVACGALVTFHATQTRFIWTEDKDEAVGEKVRSFLFFQSILTTRPDVWAKAFVKDGAKNEPSDAMLAGYFKNYISESYLIAAKIGDKLRYLKPAQSILLFAIRVMVCWLVVLVLTFAFVRPIGKPSNSVGASKPTLKTPPTQSTNDASWSAVPGGSGASQSTSQAPSK